MSSRSKEAWEICKFKMDMNKKQKKKWSYERLGHFDFENYGRNDLHNYEVAQKVSLTVMKPLLHSHT